MVLFKEEPVDWIRGFFLSFLFLFFSRSLDNFSTSHSIYVVPIQLLHEFLLSSVSHNTGFHFFLNTNNVYIYLFLFLLCPKKKITRYKTTCLLAKRYYCFLSLSATVISHQKPKILFERTPIDTIKYLINHSHRN